MTNQPTEEGARDACKRIQRYNGVQFLQQEEGARDALWSAVPVAIALPAVLCPNLSAAANTVYYRLHFMKHRKCSMSC